MHWFWFAYTSPASTRPPAARSCPSTPPRARPNAPACLPRFDGPRPSRCACCTGFGLPAPPLLPHVLLPPVPAHRHLPALDPMRPHIHPTFKPPGCPAAPAVSAFVFYPSPLPRPLLLLVPTHWHLPALDPIGPHIHLVFQPSGCPGASAALFSPFLSPTASTRALAAVTYPLAPPHASIYASTPLPPFSVS